MKSSSPVWLIVIAASFFLASCGGNLKEPEFRAIENVRTQQLGLKETNVLLDMRYYNPNSATLKLKRGEGDAWVENNYLGHFVVDTFIRIAPNGEFIIPVTLKMDMSNIVQNMSLAFLGKELNIRVEGKARVGKGMFFINYPIKYEGKQNLKELFH